MVNIISAPFPQEIYKNLVCAKTDEQDKYIFYKLCLFLKPSLLLSLCG